MDRRGGAPHRIGNQDRHTVGHHYPQHEPGLVRDDRVPLWTQSGGIVGHLAAPQHADGIAVHLLDTHQAVGARAERGGRQPPGVIVSQRELPRRKQMLRGAIEGAAFQRETPRLTAPMKCGVRLRRRHLRLDIEAQRRLSFVASPRRPIIDSGRFPAGITFDHRSVTTTRQGGQRAGEASPIDCRDN